MPSLPHSTPIPPASRLELLRAAWPGTTSHAEASSADSDLTEVAYRRVEALLFAIDYEHLAWELVGAQEGPF